MNYISTLMPQCEYDARCSNDCPACANPKEQGSLVCWDCFKRRDDITPLKYYDGDFQTWLKMAKINKGEKN